MRVNELLHGIGMDGLSRWKLCPDHSGRPLNKRAEENKDGFSEFFG